MTFPTANSVVYYNEDGEPIGWDTYRPDDAPDVDDFYNDSIGWEPDYPADPTDCDHDDVDDIVDFAPGISQGTCSWCESRVYCDDTKAAQEGYHDFTLTVPSPF